MGHEEEKFALSSNKLLIFSPMFCKCQHLLPYSNSEGTYYYFALYGEAPFLYHNIMMVQGTRIPKSQLETSSGTFLPKPEL